MGKRTRALKLIGIILGAVSAAHAGEPMVFDGSFEGGYLYNWDVGRKDSIFLIDRASLGATAPISPRTKIIVNNAFAVKSGTVSAAATEASAESYFSGATLTNAAQTFAMSNTAAFIESQFSDQAKLAFGHMKTPFGMESGWARYDMPTYYYSSAYTYAQTLGWQYDVGVKMTLTGLLPGNLEVALIEGRTITGENLPLATSLRWSYVWENEGWSLTPVATTYLGRWHGRPSDLGVTLGGLFKMGMITANAELVYTARAVIAGANRAQNWSAYFEPGMDLGFVNVSAKAEYNKRDSGAGGGAGDGMNLGVAVGHSYGEKRIRATYQAGNLAGKNGLHPNDFRLLFGTRF